MKMMLIIFKITIVYFSVGLRAPLKEFWPLVIHLMNSFVLQSDVLFALEVKCLINELGTSSSLMTSRYSEGFQVVKRYTSRPSGSVSNKSSANFLGQITDFNLMALLISVLPVLSSVFFEGQSLKRNFKIFTCSSELISSSIWEATKACKHVTNGLMTVCGSELRTLVKSASFKHSNWLKRASNSRSLCLSMNMFKNLEEDPGASK